MTAPDVDRDALLGQLLEDALAEAAARGSIYWSGWRVRQPDHVEELQRLLAMRQALDTAIAACRTPSGGVPVADPPLPERIGRYAILGRVGAGGMGTVVKASDDQLSRIVALKMMRLDGPGQALAELRGRFLREARAAAAIRHPHVCPIYDLGEHDTTPYVVMAYVEGESLADRLARGRFEDCREAVRLVCQVCEALEAVHERGVVHRDLKPANILLDREGKAVLTDFGLACLLEAEGERLTAEGAIVGTPAYMAPEQASQKGGTVGPRTDLYSLGVVLYHALTGRVPFRGTPLSMVFQVAQEEPPPPSSLRPDLDPALEAIVRKAMARDPRQRYADARQMRQALEGWLAARPRRRVPWQAVAAALVLASVVGVMASVLFVRTEHGVVEIKAPPGARVEVAGKVVVIDSAGLGRVKLTLGEHTCKIHYADGEIESKDVKLTRGGETLEVIFGRIPPPSGPFPPIPAAERFDWQPKELVAVFGSHRWRHADVGWPHTIGFDAAGTDVLVPTASWLRDPRKGYRLTVTGAATGKQVVSLAAADWLDHAVSPDGAAVAVAEGTHDDWTLRVVETATGKEKFRHRGQGQIWQSLTLGPGGRLLVVHIGDYPYLWDVESGKQLGGMFPSNMSGRRIVAFSADGKLLATYVHAGDRTGELKIWDVEKRTVLVTCDEGPRRWNTFVFSPDGKYLAHSVQWSGWNSPERVRMWDARTGKVVPTPAGWKEAVGIAFAPDGTTVALAETDGTLKLCGLPSGKVKLTVPRPPRVTYWLQMGFSPDGKRLAALSGLNNEDGGVRVWDTATGKQLHGPGDGATLWALSGDGSTAVFSGRGEPNPHPRALRVHDWKSGKDRCAVDLPPGLFFLAAGLTPDGRTLIAKVSVPGGAGVRVWDVSAASPAKIAFGTEGSFIGFALSKDGKTLATTEVSSPGNLWRGDRWKERTPLSLPAPSFTTYPPALSADGKRVAVITPTACFVCDVSTGKPLAKLDGSTPRALSHDGKQLAAVFGGKGLVVWDVENNRQVLQDRLSGVNCTIFGTDGSLYVGTAGHVVHYSSAGKVVHEWPMPARVVHLALSDGDRYLWCGLANGTTYVLDLLRR